MPEENTLKFVQTDEGSSAGGKLLQKAFEEAKAKEINVQMVPPAELLKRDLTNDKSLFVTDAFSGECFEHLTSKKKRVFGPICVLQCVERRSPIPNVYHPVYSLAMNGVVVSCTSVSRSVRDRLYELVQNMGGVVAKDFTSAVTHLVAGEVGSKKYAIACSLHKLVMLPSWVEEAWNETGDCDFDAKDSSFVSAHLCPVLKGCNVCVTGIESKKRAEIKKAVEEHGGKYSAELKLKCTTHLLVEKPDGEKYQFALRWNVHCVHPDWLYDCIQAGHWLDESQYLVKTERDLDRIRSNGRLSISTVNATLNNTIASTSGISRKAAEAARQSAASYGRKDIFDDSNYQALSGHAFRRTSCEDDLDYNVPIPMSEMFLDGCKIYLTGFTGRKVEKLQKIINAGGGTRFSQLNSSITHVVMGEKLSKDIDMLAKCEAAPHVVTAKWLLDCCQHVKCLPEQDYYCMEFNNVFEEDPNPVKEAQKQPTTKVTNKENVANDDILNQYLDLMKDDFPSLNELQQPFDNELTNGRNSFQEPNETTVADDGYNSTCNEESEELFHGLTMRINGFPDLESQLKAVIESKGGILLPKASKKIADFVVLPPDYECGDAVAKSKVTVWWLDRCIESEMLLEPTSNFLFTPFLLTKDTYPLKNCVVSISQYAGCERDHLMQLTEMLGAHYQEYFSRKNSSNVLANTHLLLQEPSGSKYEAAVKWNIPALTADWLFECARTGTKVAERLFVVGKELSEEEDNIEDRSVTEKTCDGNLSSRGSDVKLGETDEGVSSKQKMKVPSDTVEGKTPVSKETTPRAQKDVNPVINKPPAGFGRPKRPSFDLTDAIESLQSPCCSSGSSSAHSRLSRGSRSSFLLDDYIQEHMQAALKNTASLPGPRVDDQDQRQESALEKENQSGKESKGRVLQSFLDGVILNVSKKLAKQQTEIHNMASSVGADCRWSLDDSCTHVIHEGRVTKDQNQAKSKGVHIVSPHWLYTCIEEQRRVDESLYPPTFNPKLTLSVVKTRSSRGPKDIKLSIKQEKTDVDSQGNQETGVGSKELEKTDECRTPPAKKTSDEFEDVNKAAIDDLTRTEGDATMLSQDSAQSDSLRTKEEIKHIHDIMQAMKSARRRSRRLNSSNSGSNSRNSSGSESSRRNPRRQSSRLRCLRPGHADSDEEGEEQKEDMITYDDPASRIERERIIAHLANTSPNPNSDSEESENNKITGQKQGRNSKIEPSESENQKKLAIKTEAPSPTTSPSSTPAAPPIALHITSTSKMPEPVSLLDPAVELEDVKPKEILKFLLSAMSPQEKIDYAALIEELGGEVFDNQFFNPACRHAIVGQLNRSEKCLASIAAGNWVLHKSYLEASRSAGHFVNEEEHEWGLEIPGESLPSLATAARRWRIELKKKSQHHNTKRGAFQNWKVLLCVESNKVASFTRLLEAGNAEVLGTSPPFVDIRNATHAFISPAKQAPTDNVDFNRLEQAGILVLRTDYIANYLTENPAPSTDKYSYHKQQDRLKLQNRKRKPDESFPETVEKRARKT